MKDERKYPLSKSGESEDGAIMNDVYGGPEWMGKGMPDGEPEEIYAPEENEIENEKEPYPPTGPEPVPGMFRTLYGAPVLPDEERQDDKPEEGPKEAEDKLPKDLPPMPPPEALDPRMFMCVYAGPEYFNRGPQQNVGIYISPEQFKKASESRKFCTNCGTPLPENAKFCPECGRKLPSKEEKDDKND